MITNVAVAVHVASTSPHVFSGAWARRVRVTHRRTRAVSEPGVRGDDGKCGDERPPACLPTYLPAIQRWCCGPSALCSWTPPRSASAGYTADMAVG